MIQQMAHIESVNESRLWIRERLKCKTCTRALLVHMKAPDPYHRNGTLFSSGSGHISLTQREVSIGFNLGEEKEERRGNEEGGRKSIGKFPSGAGVCLTTACNNTLHTLGKCSPAWAGLRDYGKITQAYNGKHTEGRAVGVYGTLSIHASAQINAFSFLVNRI